MKEKLQNDIKYFSATTDIWSSKSMESFMPLTLHALTEDFEVINLTLAVDPLRGRHTSDFICRTMQDSFNDWGVQKDDLVLMLRDNASNAVKACNDWNVKYFGCIGHTFHLILGPLFVKKGLASNDDIKDNDNGTEYFREDGDDDDDVSRNDDSVDYDEDELLDTLNAFSNEIYRSEVRHVGKVVGNFRHIAKYVCKSTIAKEKLDSIQKANGNKTISNLELDVRTQWNSTLKMLQKLVRLRTSWCILHQYMKSPEGKQKFNHKR
jgi:hypothetical protein